MFYAKEMGQPSQYAELAMLHQQLGAAYSIIAQYEAEERKEESRRLTDFLVRQDRKARKEEGERPPGEAPDPFAPAPDPFEPAPDPFKPDDDDADGRC